MIHMLISGATPTRHHLVHCRCLTTRRPDQYPAIMYTIHMRRTAVYYVNMFVWPAVILAFLTAFMFLVPPEAGERVHIGKDAFTLNISEPEK